MALVQKFFGFYLKIKFEFSEFCRKISLKRHSVCYIVFATNCFKKLQKYIQIRPNPTERSGNTALWKIFPIFVYLVVFFFFLLSFLDPNLDIGHEQRQLSTELLTGPVVSNQARFCLDSEVLE